MQCLHPLYCLLKKRHVWDQGTEQQAASEKAKVLVKQIKALGIAQVELPSELDILVTMEGMGWGLWQKQQKPLCSGLKYGSCQRLGDLHKIAILAVDMMLLHVGPPTKKSSLQ